MLQERLPKYQTSFSIFVDHYNEVMGAKQAANGARAVILGWHLEELSRGLFGWKFFTGEMSGKLFEEKYPWRMSRGCLGECLGVYLG